MYHHLLESRKSVSTFSGLSPLDPHPLQVMGLVLDLRGPVYTGLSYPDNIPLTLDTIPETSSGIQAPVRFGAE